MLLSLAYNLLKLHHKTQKRRLGTGLVAPVIFQQDYSCIELNIGNNQGVPINLFSTPGWICTDSKEYHKF